MSRFGHGSTHGPAPADFASAQYAFRADSNRAAGASDRYSGPLGRSHSVFSLTGCAASSAVFLSPYQHPLGLSAPLASLAWALSGSSPDSGSFPQYGQMV